MNISKIMVDLVKMGFRPQITCEDRSISTDLEFIQCKVFIFGEYDLMGSGYGQIVEIAMVDALTSLKKNINQLLSSDNRTFAQDKKCRMFLSRLEEIDLS